MRFARFIGMAGLVMSGLLVTSVASADGRDVDVALDRPPPPTGAVQRPTRQDISVPMRTPLQTYAMRPRHVDERYVRDLGNGCDYVATVRGTIKPRDSRNGSPAFRSDLTQDAHVECRGHVVATAPLYRLHRGRITDGEIRSALSASGRITTTTGDRRCQYTPTYAIVNNHIETRAVFQSCNTRPTAIGGGPRR